MSTSHRVAEESAAPLKSLVDPHGPGHENLFRIASESQTVANPETPEDIMTASQREKGRTRYARTEPMSRRKRALLAAASLLLATGLGASGGVPAQAATRLGTKVLEKDEAYAKIYYTADGSGYNVFAYLNDRNRDDGNCVYMDFQLWFDLDEGGYHVWARADEVPRRWACNESRRHIKINLDPGDVGGDLAGKIARGAAKQTRIEVRVCAGRKPSWHSTGRDQCSYWYQSEPRPY